MIIKYIKGAKKYRFINKLDHKDNNIFTIIVGRNGSGKSRLLSSIIKQCIDSSKTGKSFRQAELGFEEIETGQISIDKEPNKIIAVSSSAFDKFPIYTISERLDDRYKYLGIRNLGGRNFGLAYMTKIINDLIKITSVKPNQFLKVSKVLHYLGFSDIITVKFQFRFTKPLFTDLNQSEDKIKFFAKFFSPKARARKSFFSLENDNWDSEKIETLIDVLKRRKNWRKQKYDVNISKTGIESPIFEENFIHDFNFCLDSGIIKLIGVSLKKTKTNKQFSLNQASSGEQSLITTFLGIACHIEDDSLICIDEPEISLHPEWQEKYISFLVSTFSDYKRCHFLIASHSPQIVSKLSPSNSYILKMDNLELVDAKNFSHESIDFQLANIFNSPGFKNEYLNRIAFSIMSKVAHNKTFDEEDNQHYKIIKSQMAFIETEDPLSKLFVLLTELKSNYA